jgi:nicotinamide-nucleotide amidase
MPRIEIITIGDELIEGRLVDTNACELSDRLTGIGLRAREHRSVGDDMADMVDALRTAAGRSEAVLVSGGLGPTSDDLTAIAAARAFGLEIERSPEALEHTRRFFTERGREMPPTNEKQADLPLGCAILPNPEGTAVGFRLDAGSCRLYFMPGVPRELRRMADESVLTDLRRRLIADPPLVATLKLFGLGESEVAQRLEGIHDLVPVDMNLTVQYRATFPEIHLRLVLTGGDRTAATEVLDFLTADARRHLGDHVFAVGGARLDIDFPAAVAAALSESGLSLAAAEVATSGAVARMLGASEYGRECFRGSVVTADLAALESQLRLTDISPETAAHAVRQQFGSSIGIATFGSPEGMGGLRPGTFVAAAAGPGGTQVRELHFPIDHDRFQRLTAYASLKLAIRITRDQT